MSGKSSERVKILVIAHSLGFMVRTSGLIRVTYPANAMSSGTCIVKGRLTRM